MVNVADSTLMIKMQIVPNSTAPFASWLSKFRAQVSQTLGFSSLEILAPSSTQHHTWLLNLRFSTKEYLDLWLKSPQYIELLKELTEENLIINQHAIFKEARFPYSNGVTEVYVTFVDSSKLLKFHEWHEKIHKIESTFPGFQKVYIQAPDPQKKEGAWITLLQFDRLANLEYWLNSPQRKEILKESENFVTSKETHQLFSSFGGWFNDQSLPNPPKWKQTMLILLVLYPIVMIQSLYLTNHLSFLEPALKTFVENVICVSLLTWPFLPLIIYLLRWWLELKITLTKNLLGIGILLMAYAMEVLLFLKLSKS